MVTTLNIKLRNHLSSSRFLHFKFDQFITKVNFRVMFVIILIYHKVPSKIFSQYFSPIFSKNKILKNVIFGTYSIQMWSKSGIFPLNPTLWLTFVILQDKFVINDTRIVLERWCNRGAQKPVYSISVNEKFEENIQAFANFRRFFPLFFWSYVSMTIQREFIINFIYIYFQRE